MIGGIPLLVFLAAAATNVATSDVPQESSFYDDETVTSDVLISDGLVKLRIESRLSEGVLVNVSCTVDSKLYSPALSDDVQIKLKGRGDVVEFLELQEQDRSFGHSFHVQVRPAIDWDERELICTYANHSSNSVLLNINKISSGFPKGGRGLGARSVFGIVDRYPTGYPGEIASLTLKPDVRFNFNCSTTEEWLTCKWKTPLSEDPCGMFKYQSQQSCGFADTTIRNQFHNGLHVCSISGTLDPNLPVQGTWNCDLVSTPIDEEGDIYDDDQQFFQLKLLKPAEIKFDAGRRPEAELFETEKLEMTCSANNGFPAPTIQWYMNSQPIPENDQYFRVIEKDGPEERGEERFYYKEVAEYTSSLTDNGKSISCRARQTDDENNVSEVYNEDSTVHLYIKPIPEPEAAVVTAEMITGIVLLILALLLLLAILGFAFYTKRWCFSTPIVVVGATKDKETGEMVVQTDDVNGIIKKSGHTISTETEPLLGKALETQTEMLVEEEPDIGKENNNNFSNDQMIKFEYEGTGSLAGSLSSIESSQSSVDLETEFLALGHRFKHLATIFGQDAEEDEDDNKVYISSGGEIEV